MRVGPRGTSRRCRPAAQNISNSGAFIQTDFSFHFNIDQQITMILSPPKSEKEITVGGRITRVDSKGIGVKFDELLSVH